MSAAEAARHRLAEERASLQETLEASRSLGAGSLDGDLSSVDQHPGDIATDLTSRETAQALVDSAQAQIARLDEALARLDAGVYGRCELCGADIEDARLEILPAARTCIEHRDDDARLPQVAAPPTEP